MNLEEAIKEKDKIFPMKEVEYIPTIMKEAENYVELMNRLYDKGYELIKRKGKK